MNLKPLHDVATELQFTLVFADAERCQYRRVLGEGLAVDLHIYEDGDHGTLPIVGREPVLHLTRYCRGEADLRNAVVQSTFDAVATAAERGLL